MPSTPETAVAWVRSHGLVGYEDAVSVMEQRAQAIAEERACEGVWLLEHPPLYTAGTSAKAQDLIQPVSLPVFATGRGGQYTYHGPGQRVAYVMLDVRKRFGSDVRGFVKGLERWIIDALSTLGVKGRTIDGRIGVWIDVPGQQEAKVAALGIRVRRGVSFHGISLNIDPDMSDYAGIVPCGIGDRGVTSLAALGVSASMTDVDRALRNAFEHRFGLTFNAPDMRSDISIIRREQ